MPLKSETKTIGGNQYTVTVLPVQTGREALVRLQKLLGAAFGAITTGARADIPLAIARIAESLSASDLEWFCSVFGKATNVEIPPDEDFPKGRVLVLAKNEEQTTLFAGKYADMFEWLEFCLEVNFTDLLEKIKGALANVNAPKAEPTK